MKSEFESRETFECIFGGEGEIDLSKDETGEYSFQPSLFAYSFFLVAWQYRQNEVDELKLQVAEMKSRLNDAYTDGQSAMYTARQSKVDELQRRNQMLNDNIKEQGQKLVYQNEVIETQAEKLLCLRDEKAELQKRVDAVKGLVIELKKLDMENGSIEITSEFVEEIICDLEQALKGGEESKPSDKNKPA